MDVVHYKINGAEMYFVEIERDPCEAAAGVAGNMMFMDAGTLMSAALDDGD